jgi:predicted RNA-binding Zn ribbon-like protein
MSKKQDAPGALDLVREFVNTMDIEEGTDGLATPVALAEWLSEHDLAKPGVAATQRDLSRAIDLREALREMLLAHTLQAAPPETAGETLEAAARRARVRLRFEPDGDSTLEPEAGNVDGSLGRLLAIVHAARADGTWERLKACREHTCAWAFYDHTKNRSGTWCSMAVCGNRAKARSYRERHEHPPAPRAAHLRGPRASVRERPLG